MTEPDRPAEARPMAPSSASHAATKRELLGTWSLQGYAVDFEDGTGAEPYGTDPVGFLHYAANGHVFVHMMARDRPMLRADTDMADADAARMALGTHLSYGGRYEIAGEGRILHHVSVCVMQDVVGTTLERSFTLAGDTLALTARRMTFSGKPGSARLVWRRHP